MAVTMENIKELRAATGAGVVDCRNALVACDGDVDKAADWLREKGIAKAAKKASRIAAEGLTEIAVAANTAVVIEVNSETDFVAKNEKFQKLVKALAAAVLAAKPANMEEALKVKMETGTLQEVITDATFTIGEKISFRRFEVVNKKDSESFGAYVHMGGKIAALTVVEGQDQEELARDLAMHVAALSPSYVSMNDIPKDVVEWIWSDNMTDEEKAANPTYETTGGYLKVLNESECGQLWWNHLSTTQKEIVKSIPNFDAEIFFEVSGIDLRGE